MLTRLGNKSSLASEIWPLFPKHKMRIEFFFGAGGMFFNSPKAKYNVLNDLDDDVFNLYRVLQERKDELFNAIEIVPVSQSLVTYWKKNPVEDPLQKAVRFLLLSNFTYLGKGYTIRVGFDNAKKVLLDNIDTTFKELGNSKIVNYDFREVLSKVSFSKGQLDRKDTFGYLDPVYFETEHYYKVPKWTWKETNACFDILSDSGINCAMSEFDHPKIIKEAKRRNLNIIPIKERGNIKNRRLEILITNFKSNQLKMEI